MRVQVRAAREDTRFEWQNIQYVVGYYDGCAIEVGDELEFLYLITSLNKQCGDVIVNSKHDSSVDASLMIYNGYLE